MILVDVDVLPLVAGLSYRDCRHDNNFSGRVSSDSARSSVNVDCAIHKEFQEQSHVGTYQTP